MPLRGGGAFVTSMAGKTKNDNNILWHATGLTHHDIEGVDTCDVHGGKEYDKVGHHTAKSTQQRRSGPITLRGVPGPVNVAATVHLQ